MDLKEPLRNIPPSPGLAYPFDRYQRHRDVQIVIEQMAAVVGRPLRVLDVGGEELTQTFLPKHSVVVTNYSRARNLAVQSSGAALPFADNAFDVVVTMDTLEHIPPAFRQPFVTEMARVASGFVLITGPFASQANQEAEQLLDEYIVQATGTRHYYLAEHITYGLPELADVTQCLTGAGCATAAIPSGYTMRWITMMLLRFSLETSEEGRAAAAWLEELYNHQFYWADHIEPSYRQIVVAAKQGPAEFLSRLVGLFEDGRKVYGEPDLTHLLSLWQATTVAGKFAQNDTQRASLQAEKDALADHIRALESGRFMRTMAMLHTLRSRVSAGR